jgi:hypothetical protein
MGQPAPAGVGRGRRKKLIALCEKNIDNTMNFNDNRLLKNDQAVNARSSATKQSPDYPQKKAIASLPLVARNDGWCVFQHPNNY